MGFGNISADDESNAFAAKDAKKSSYTPITQWYRYRYRPISHIPILELELGLSVKFGISGINIRMYLVWCRYHQTATLKDLISKKHMHGQTDKDNRIAALTPQNYVTEYFHKAK